MNSKVYILSIKHLVLCDGIYYSNGGFPESIYSYKPYFQSIELCCHVKKTNEVPKGWRVFDCIKYNITIIPLPPTENILKAFLLIPYMFFQVFSSISSSNYVNCRAPDWIGLIGLFASLIFRKKHSLQIIADWKQEQKSYTYSFLQPLRSGLKLYYNLYLFFESALSKYSHHVFCQGETIYQRLNIPPSRKSIVLNSSITESYIEQCTSLRPADRDKSVIKLLSIGRLVSIKNHILIIEALNFLPVHYELTIIGSGVQKNNILELTREKSLCPRVSIYDECEHSYLLDFYKSHDIFVLPSLSEGSPKVILEAMLSKIPIVASNVGAIPYMLGYGERGTLFESNNKYDLAQKILSCSSSFSINEAALEKAFCFARVNTIDNLTKFILSKSQKFDY